MTLTGQQLQQVPAIVAALQLEFQHVSVSSGYDVVACCHRDPIRQEFDGRFGGCQFEAPEQRTNHYSTL